MNEVSGQCGCSKLICAWHPSRRNPSLLAIKQQIEKDIVQARTEVESFAFAIR